MKIIPMCENQFDANGNPTGGTANSLGMNIQWQDGPLGRSDDERATNHNGAFVETVLEAALQRLQFYQTSPFNCRENALAITKIEEAIMWLNSRTQRREAEGVEGTHQK